MGDVFNRALHMARGAEVWTDSEPLPWDGENCARSWIVAGRVGLEQAGPRV